MLFWNLTANLYRACYQCASDRGGCIGEETAGHSWMWQERQSFDGNEINAGKGKVIFQRGRSFQLVQQWELHPDLKSPWIFQKRQTNSNWKSRSKAVTSQMKKVVGAVVNNALNVRYVIPMSDTNAYRTWEKGEIDWLSNHTPTRVLIPSAQFSELTSHLLSCCRSSYLLAEGQYNCWAHSLPFHWDLASTSNYKSYPLAKFPDPTYPIPSHHIAAAIFAPSRVVYRELRFGCHYTLAVEIRACNFYR